MKSFMSLVSTIVASAAITSAMASPEAVLEANLTNNWQFTGKPVTICTQAEVHQAQTWAAMGNGVSSEYETVIAFNRFCTPTTPLTAAAYGVLLGREFGTADKLYENTYIYQAKKKKVVQEVKEGEVSFEAQYICGESERIKLAETFDSMMLNDRTPKEIRVNMNTLRANICQNSEAEPVVKERIVTTSQRIEEK